MRRLFATALLCLLSSCGTLTPAIALDRGKLMERLGDLNAWVRLNTAYKARHLPKVVIRTAEDMARISFGESFRPDLIGWIRAQAMSGVVFLPPDIATDGAEDEVLVHELVHFQQFEAGKGEISSCEREREAYALQDRFVDQMGRGKKSDPMTVMLIVAACDQP